MGWFSKKRQVTVALQFTQLAEDADPKTLMNTVLGAVLQNTSISKALREEISRGFYSKVMSAYRYGLSGYSEGLPESSIVNFALDNPDVLVVLSRVVGNGPKTIRSYSVSKPNASMIAHKYLAATYGWNSATNTFPNSNKKLYAATFLMNDDTQVHIEWREDINGTITPSFELYTHGLDLDNQHLYVEYCTTANAPETQISYVLLEDLTLGNHPELDDDVIASNPYFPIIPLRLRKVNINSSLPNVKYTTSTKLLKKIGLDMGRLLDAVLSTEEGNNPDQVDSVYFYSMRDGLVTKAIFLDHVANKYGPAPYNAVIINEGEFNVILSWNYIDITEHIGKFPTLKTGDVLKTWYFGGDQYTILGGEHYNGSTLELIHQYSGNNYRRIKVFGLEQGVDVYEGNYVVSNIDTAFNLGDQAQGLYVPITKNVLDDMHPLRKNDVAQSSLTMVVYAVDIQYIKWYERSKILKAIAFVVTLVITIIYPPAGAAAASITALLVNTIVNIVLQIIISKIIIKAAFYLGELVGADLAGILAVVATIAAVAYSPGNLLQATDLLNAATGLQLSYGKDLNKKIKQLEKDKLDFQKELDIKNEGIDKQLDTFASESTLTTLRGSIGLLAPYESADDYYRRTLFNTDMTEAVFALVSAYHDMALTLPVTLEGRKI
jgi:hypothetical protein